MNTKMQNKSALREEIIFGRPIAWGQEEIGGVVRFDGLFVEDLNLLFEEGLIDPDDCQNESPAAAIFFDFMKLFPDVYAHGYVVSPFRSDSRVTIEGLAFKGNVSMDLRNAFVNLCREADDLRVGESSLFSWWD